MTKIFQIRACLNINPEKCTGCGACADVCPRKAIKISQKDAFTILKHRYGICLYCRQCARTCPQKAITFAAAREPDEFHSELTSDQRANVPMEVCQKCGKPFATTPLLANVNKSLQEASMVIPDSIHICPNCRNKELATNMWLVWKGKK